MAKKSMILRDVKRAKLVKRYAKKREELKGLVRYYGRDIVGNFDPRVYKFATGIGPTPDYASSYLVPTILTGTGVGLSLPALTASALASPASTPPGGTQ